MRKPTWSAPSLCGSERSAAPSRGFCSASQARSPAPAPRLLAKTKSALPKRQRSSPHRMLMGLVLVEPGPALIMALPTSSMVS